MKKIVIFLCLSVFFCSCEDLLNPAVENNKTLEDINQTQEAAMGILGSAYAQMPYSYQAVPQSDVATDDAVTNDFSSGYLKAATGGWSAMSNPFDQWQSRRNAIQYANIFISTVESVRWDDDQAINALFADRMKGEALALRGLNMYFLLMAHGGMSDGELMGVPILTEPEGINSDFNRPRDTFKACVDQVVADLTEASKLLPMDYVVHSYGDIPQKYIDLGLSSVDEYDRVMGVSCKGRISARIAKALMVQTLLMAASPAFELSGYTYKQAADCAAELLNSIGGIEGIDPEGDVWYKTYQETVSAGSNPQEIIWRPNVTIDNALEGLCFPPTLYGNGRINPSQNLIDAFPMANGYPISDKTNSGYNDQDPYSSRDPRMANYILWNEAQLNGSTITTGDYATTTDGLNKESGKSTRTGYYMLKHLITECNPNPSYNTTKKHLCAYIRYTEIYLAYAEAALEAYGVTRSADGCKFSAYDVVKAIRSRAGIDNSGSDSYLELIKDDEDAMRKLIRNERRLELCFENIRFWDLRRWGSDLNETVTGMKITKDDSGLKSYEVIDVEKRDYKTYMNYGPIPYGEIKKWSNLKQNSGWN